MTLGESEAVGDSDGNPSDGGIDHIEADPGSLDALFGAIQGNGPKVLGDAGLARFAVSRLLTIERGARRRAEDCTQDLQCLSRLLTQVLLMEDQPLRMADLAVAARHLGKLAQDGERWSLLAEHAALYRSQRAVAQDVALHWLRWAHHFHEWPQAG